LSPQENENRFFVMLSRTAMRSTPLGCAVVTFLVVQIAVQISVTVSAAESTPRPQLQIINGGDVAVDLFWLNDDGDRVPNGRLAAGEDKVIRTTLGHRFEIANLDGETLATVTSKVLVQGFRWDPDGRDGVPPFYTQQASAGGFPVVASATVNPYALREATYLINQMLAQRDDLRQALIDSGARMCIIAYNEFTTDLPEFAPLARSSVRGFPQLDPKDYWDARARGTGGSTTDPFCSCGEENLLAYPGDPYAAECILIHEFAHCIHLRGMSNLDPQFDARLKRTYQQAMQRGLWKGKYASVNHHEYFAEGVQSWFDDNREDDHDHNHVNTRAELLAYDPGLAAICREVFGETAIRYTKPTQRLEADSIPGQTNHLLGYDPAAAPRFAWPRRLQQAKQVIQQQARQREADAATHKVRDLLGWKLSIHKALLTEDQRKMTERAIELLTVQLEEIVEQVPPAAVVELRKVPLWFSPEYPGTQPRAEYHPGAGWLRDNGRDPAMERCIEFTNIRVFEAETRRMPNFALHELAHAYHHRFLPQGFQNPQLKSAYQRAKASGTYDHVERQDSEGRKRLDRAYALTNPQEYFAETTEAYFSSNDFFPFNREELAAHDPAVTELLPKLWSAAPLPE